MPGCLIGTYPVKVDWRPCVVCPDELAVQVVHTTATIYRLAKIAIDVGVWRPRSVVAIMLNISAPPRMDRAAFGALGSPRRAHSTESQVTRAACLMHDMLADLASKARLDLAWGRRKRRQETG